MAATVLMPKAGITVESCIIGAWNKKVGDSVAIGEVLFSYETDKAVFDCESTAEGTILAILHAEGEEVAVLTPVCAVGHKDEVYEPSASSDEVFDLTASSDEAYEPAASSDEVNEPAASSGESYIPAASSGAGSVPAASSGAVKASPRAKNLAKRLGVEIANAYPTGPHGRVIERDVETLARAGQAAGVTSARTQPSGTTHTTYPGAVQTQPSGVAAGQSSASVSAAAGQPASSDAPGYTDIKMPKIRRVIADAMLKSLSELAQLTHHHSFDASKLLELREEFKKDGARYGLDGATIGDLILFAVSRVLVCAPEFNAHLLDGGTIRQFRGVNLGVAMATDRGLLVPTIFDADKKSLRQISTEVRELAGAVRSGSISPDKMSGATFTVSNLGATGVEMFTPIINPPQVAILGVCGIVTRVRETRGGGIKTYPSMGLSLTYDHRAVDGAPASAFAQKICAALEGVNLLLIGG